MAVKEIDRLKSFYQRYYGEDVPVSTDPELAQAQQDLDESFAEAAREDWQQKTAKRDPYFDHESYNS